MVTSDHNGRLQNLAKTHRYGQVTTANVANRLENQGILFATQKGG